MRPRNPRPFGDDEIKVTRVIVELREGTVEHIYADGPVHYAILDHDNGEVDEDALEYNKRLDRQKEDGKFRRSKLAF